MQGVGRGPRKIVGGGRDLLRALGAHAVDKQIYNMCIEHPIYPFLNILAFPLPLALCFCLLPVSEKEEGMD